MKQYYLMAQLPSLEGLDPSAPLPITPEEFRERCSRFLDPKGMQRLQKLSLTPDRAGEPSGSALLDAWNEQERQLRLALAVVRAAKMKKSFDSGSEPLPAPLMQTAQSVLELEDPLAAEKTLNEYRLDTLRRLSPLDSFCEDAVLHYGLQLLLLSRMRQFDTDRGQAAYENLYSSILHGAGEEMEV